MNPEAMSHIKLSYKKGALIANPNCSTIICLMAATPLHRHAKVSISLLVFLNAHSTHAPFNISNKKTVDFLFWSRPFFGPHRIEQTLFFLRCQVLD